MKKFGLSILSGVSVLLLGCADDLAFDDSAYFDQEEYGYHAYDAYAPAHAQANPDNAHEQLIAHINSGAGPAPEPDYHRVTGPQQSQQPHAKGGLKYFYLTDEALGMPSGRIQLPADWVQLKGNKEFIFEGPNKIRVSTTNGGTFAFTNNPDMMQVFRMQGQQNQPPMSIDEIVQKFFMPVARQTGKELMRTYELPALARKAYEDTGQYYSALPQQRQSQAYALEWRDGKGMSYVSVVNINISYGQHSSFWVLMSQYLEAPHSEFEAARDALIQGMVTAETNPQWLAVKNQESRRRAEASSARHAANMASSRAVNNSVAQTNSIYNDISDITHNGYMNRNAMNDAGHQRTINGLAERTVIANPQSGQRYNVDSGSNQYWVNPNNQYFGSDNPNYDPRLDPAMNSQQWEEYYEVR